MEISKDELEEIIARTIKTALADERTEFRVPPRQHFLDHEQLHSCKESMAEWLLNHDFVTPIRKGVGEVKKSAFKSIFGLLGIGILIAVAMVLAKIKGW